MNHNPFYNTHNGVNQHVVNLVKENNFKNYCEIGCNVGTTAIAVGKVMPDSSNMFLFDYKHNIDRAKDRVKESGLQEKLNTSYFSNGFKERDNYCWSLAKVVKENKVRFDFVYIDGSHDFTIDSLAFFLCDLLLEQNGIVHFDDMNWCFMRSPSASPSVYPKTAEWYTEDQMNISQNRFFVEHVLDMMGSYEEIHSGTYKKIG